MSDGIVLFIVGLGVFALLVLPPQISAKCLTAIRPVRKTLCLLFHTFSQNFRKSTSKLAGVGHLAKKVHFIEETLVD